MLYSKNLMALKQIKTIRMIYLMLNVHEIFKITM